MAWWGRRYDPEDVATQARVKVNRFNRTTNEEEKRLLLNEMQELAANPTTHEELGAFIPNLMALLSGTTELEILRCGTNILEAVLSTEDTDTAVSSHVPLVNEEAVVKDPHNLEVFLQLLSNKDVYVRVSTCKILQRLAMRKLRNLQAAVLSHPMGVSKLMDLVRDPRDYVRNEGLLLMISLCEDNQEIQKITAFDSAFECLFNIIEEEFGGNEVVVLDALELIKILLAGNSSNVVYFRETGCAPHLLPLLKVEGSDVWLLTDSKQKIIISALEIVIELLPRSSATSDSSHQLLHKLGFSDVILKLALGRVNSILIREKALETLAIFLLDESHKVRNWFSSAVVFLPLQEDITTPDMSQLALNRLATVLLHSPEFTERMAGLNAFRCFLHSNEDGQIALVTTFTPSPDDIDNEMSGMASLDSPQSQSSIGRRLLGCLFGWSEGSAERAQRVWVSANLIAGILKSNTAKAFALQRPLRVQIHGRNVENLMKGVEGTLHSLFEMSSQKELSKKSQTDDESKIVVSGLLLLLCSWLHGSDQAVGTFLSNNKNVPLLVSLTTTHHHFEDIHIQGLAALLLGVCLEWNPNVKDSPFNVENLRKLLMTKIGKDKFMSLLSRVRFCQEFIVAEQDELDVHFFDIQKTNDTEQDRSAWGHISKYLYDYEFTHIFKEAYDSSLRYLSSGPSRSDKSRQTPHPPEYDNYNNNNNNDLMSPLRSTDGGGPQSSLALEAMRSEYEAQIQHYKNLLQAQQTGVEKREVSDEMKRRLWGNGSLPVDLQGSRVEDVLFYYKEKCAQLAEEVKVKSESMQSMSRIITDLEGMLMNQNQTSGASSVDKAPSEEVVIMKDIIERLEAENELLQLQVEEMKLKNASMAELQNSQNNEKIIRLEHELTEAIASQRALEGEQEELLLCLVKEEMESGNLRERVRQLEAELQSLQASQR